MQNASSNERRFYRTFKRLVQLHPSWRRSFPTVGLASSRYDVNVWLVCNRFVFGKLEPFGLCRRGWISPVTIEDPPACQLASLIMAPNIQQTLAVSLKSRHALRSQYIISMTAR